MAEVIDIIEDESPTLIEAPDYDDSVVDDIDLKREIDNAKLAKHYVRRGTTSFGFVDDVINDLPAAFYRPMWDSYNRIATLEKLHITLPKLYHLPDNVFETIVADVERFWQSEKVYRKFGNVYKRNILLYSTPGNGKTSLINLLAFELINKYKGIIITINSSQDLHAYTKCIERIRNVEPNRKIITIIEDFDGIVGSSQSDETLLLQILDGNNQYDNVVTIATTNYPEALKPSFTNRPSRFNFVIEYKKPSAEVRSYYYTNKLKDCGIDVESEEIKTQIERLTQKSEGFTFDYCKELLEMIFVMGYNEDNAVNRIKDIIAKKGRYTITEDKSKIGF